MKPLMVYYLVKCTNSKCREVMVTAAKTQKICKFCGTHIKVTSREAERTELTLGGIL